MAKSFLWYDLETFGRDARRSRIAQFAGIRTDEALNEINEPISWFCQPASDLLPSPEAAMITGISPQQAMRDGFCEAEFFAMINDELMTANTCAVGYNSIRFDDEFIRFGLYRNFYDAYEREYKNGNSRWDLLDFMRRRYFTALGRGVLLMHLFADDVIAKLDALIANINGGARNQFAHLVLALAAEGTVEQLVTTVTLAVLIIDHNLPL